MLIVNVPGREYWDEENEKFKSVKAQELHLEHSLVSISKWESKWHKAFLGKQEKTAEEMLDYVRCMCVTPNIPNEVFYSLTDENVKQINEYIKDPHTATVVTEAPGAHRNPDVMTSELIYYYMITLNIPVEFQKWHLNRLLTLIRVCNKKNSPPKKMGRSELIARNDALNAKRRAALHSKG
jgi:hypothetical protein